MRYILDDREVEIDNVQFERGGGAWAGSAMFTDTEKELNEDELERLNVKYCGELYQEGLENLTEKAYDHYEARYKYGE